MEIIVDTSVIIAVVANEPVKESLIRLTQGAALVAPASVHWEIANAFSAMLKRQRIKIEQAVEALEAYQQIPLRLVDVELDISLEIANYLSIYAYDAYLLRCAQKYRLPLLTLDQNLTEKGILLELDVIEVP